MSVPDWMIDAPQASVDDLAALVRRLARALRKAAPDNDLPDQAVDYLRRHHLAGSILRDPALAAQTETQPASEAVQINGKPATAHSLLAALVDIHDDEEKNAPEHRCYIPSAYSEVMDRSRTFLATRARPAPAPAPWAGKE